MLINGTASNVDRDLGTTQIIRLHAVVVGVDEANADCAIR
jgi:hypothetical protein